MSQADIARTLKRYAANSGYDVVPVQWCDVARTHGSALGPHITDTYLHAKDAVVSILRPSNMNPKIACVAAKDIGVMQAHGEGLKPATLDDYLRNFPANAAYVCPNAAPPPLYAENLDDKVQVLYQVAFVGANAGQPTECRVSHYNYQSGGVVLLCTTQGTAVVESRNGMATMYLHNEATRTQHVLDIEPTRFGVGGPQRETAEERAAARARGVASSAVLGTQPMGSVLNTFMTVTVPTANLSQPELLLSNVEVDCLDDSDDDLEMDCCLLGADTVDTQCEKAPPVTLQYRSAPPQRSFGASNTRAAPPASTSSAGRVSKGRSMGQVAPLTAPATLRRHPTHRLQVTITMFYATLATPTQEDVNRAVNWLDKLYGAAAAQDQAGRLFDQQFAGTFTTPAAPQLGVHVADPDTFPTSSATAATTAADDVDAAADEVDAAADEVDVASGWEQVDKPMEM